MKKLLLNGSYIYVDDSEVDVKTTGVVCKDDTDLEKTQEIELNFKDNDLEDTITNLWGDNSGK